MTNGMRGSHKAAVAIIAVLAGAGLIYTALATDVFRERTASTAPVIDLTDDEGGVIQGLTTGDTINVDYVHRNSEDGTAYTEGTHTTCSTAHRTGPSSFDLGVSGTSVDYEIKDGDTTEGGLGLVYFMCENEAAADSLIVDSDAINDKNSNKIKYLAYIDHDGDGDRHWFAAISTENKIPYRLGAGTVPSIEITVPWQEENTVTVSAPSDNTAIGEVSGELDDTTWQLTGTEADVTLLRELWFTLNQTGIDWSTATSIVKIETGSETVSLNLRQFTETSDGSNTIYKYIWGDYQDEALKLVFPQNVGSSTLDITLTMSWSLENNDVITNQITIRTINQDDGENSDVTDTVSNNEA